MAKPVSPQSTIPQKISLVSQTRAILSEGMRSGRWRGSLPGQRRLCEELHISRWTLEAALDALSRDGLVKIQHGYACKILPAPAGTPLQPKRAPRVALLVPQPLARLRQFVLLWVDDLRLTLNDRGIGFAVIDSINAYRAKPARVLHRLVDENPHDAWVLMLSTRAIQAWFQQQDVPAIITGACADGIGLPALDPDHRAAGVHAGHVLLRLGHRRIAFVRPPLPAAGNLATEAGLRSAIKSETRGTPELRVLTGDSREEINRMIERSLITPAPPTAFVFARAFAAITALTFLTSRGCQVPGDVSVMSVEPEPVFEHLVPTMAYYTLSPALYAKRMARMITQRLNGTASYETQHLELAYVPGKSVGRVHGGAP